MTTTADLAESLVKLEDLLARPAESFPPHEMGTPMRHQCLSHYGPVQPWNVSAAARLLEMYFYQDLRALRRQWAALPVEVRRRIEIHVALIKLKRSLASLELELNRLMEENRMAVNFPCQKCGAVERTTDRYPTLAKKPCPQCGEETEREASKETGEQ